ncbi:MAG TPA: PPK2 family polyphosphate kinase [Acidimicrobiales bacterium]|nr:PPK2 family polyphosphate kinase [Acidimicrobiales bacterium]
MADGAALHRVEPGTEVDLSRLPTLDTSAAPGGKAATLTALEDLKERLHDLQEVLYAEQRRRVLLVVQGLDTSGKGGILEHVVGAVNPIGLRLTSFKAPSDEELSRDYLWRVHANVPKAGELGVFDRSHYEDVIAARVEGIVPEAVWQRRYDHIVGFERLLADEGTALVKVLLHLSKDEQRRRLQARLDEPHKRWKFNPDDLRTRARWDEHQVAMAEAVERTAQPHAPWHVVPADKKWYARWAVATILVATLDAMDLQWPDPPDLSGVVID